MNYFILILSLAFIALLQSTLMPHLLVFTAKPNLMLLTVISATLATGSEESIIWAFVGGLWLDLFSGAPLGTSAIALVIISYVLGRWSSSLFRGNLMILVIGTLLSVMAYESIQLVLLFILGRPTAWVESFIQVVLPNAVYNAALIAFVYPVVARFSRVITRQRPSMLL